MAYNFQNRKVYSFDVYPAAILGTGFKNVTVSAVIDYETALNYGDIDAQHVNVFSYLPAGTPNRPQDFDYLLLRTSEGTLTVIGVPWIVEETIELVQALKMSVTIDGVGNADVDRVRACLTQNGYNNIAIALIGQ